MNVWQNPQQYSKVISLQLKFKKVNNNKKIKAKDRTVNISAFIYTYMCSVAHSYPTHCNPVVRSPAGSSVHGIFQARILERVAISSSRGSSRSGDRTRVFCVSSVGSQIFYHCHNKWHTLLCMCNRQMYTCPEYLRKHILETDTTRGLWEEQGAWRTGKRGQGISFHSFWILNTNY